MAHNVKFFGYKHGHHDGEVDARLMGHDVHFAALNGHLADLKLSVHNLEVSLERLVSQLNEPVEDKIKALQNRIIELERVKDLEHAVADMRAVADMAARSVEPLPKVVRREPSRPVKDDSQQYE